MLTRVISKVALSTIVSASLTAATFGSSKAANIPDVRAEADIFECTDSDQGRKIGFARLLEFGSEEGVKEVLVRINIEGNEVLTPGKHGVHIHEVGDCTPCGAAGGHFDPGPASDSRPDANHPYHSGDLINLTVNSEGAGTLKVLTTRITLSPGPLSIFDDDGSAFIIHVDPDTYCPEGEVAGCAGGARAACGIIRQMDD